MLLLLLRFLLEYDARTNMLTYFFNPCNVCIKKDAHNVAIYCVKLGLAPTFRPNKLESSQQVSLSIRGPMGILFPNVVGLAAGFDKDGIAIQGLMDLGFGFVEIGSVTPKPQPGNSKPRMFRLKEDLGVINRFGFNSVGMMTVEENLKDFRKQASVKNNASTGHGDILPEEQKKDIANVVGGFVLNTGRNAWRLFSPQRHVQEKSLLGVNLGKNKTSTDETQVS